MQSLTSPEVMDKTAEIEDPMATPVRSRALSDLFDSPQAYLQSLPILEPIKIQLGDDESDDSAGEDEAVFKDDSGGSQTSLNDLSQPGPKPPRPSKGPPARPPQPSRDNKTTGNTSMEFAVLM